MHFHICLANMPAQFRESLLDLVTYLGAALAECGCRVTYDDARVIFGGSAINLFIEYFDSSSADDLIATKRAKGADFPFGILSTEDLGDPMVMTGEFAWRAAAFRRVAEVADFVWYVMPGTAGYPDIVDPAKCSFLEFGYCADFMNIAMQPERDIDFLLPGLAYPRRKPILAALHARGYHVRSTDLATPAYIYRSLIGRTKAILEIRRFEETRNLSILRLCLAAGNGIAAIAEKVDPIAFSEMYRYTIPADFESYVERCIEFVERENPIAVGAEIRARFEAERPARPRTQRLLDAPIFEAYRRDAI